MLPGQQPVDRLTLEMTIDGEALDCGLDIADGFGSGLYCLGCRQFAPLLTQRGLPGGKCRVQIAGGTTRHPGSHPGGFQNHHPLTRPYERQCRGKAGDTTANDDNVYLSIAGKKRVLSYLAVSQ